MVSIYGNIKRPSPSDRVKFQEKAYDKALNMIPAQQKRQEKEKGLIRDKATDTIAEQAKQGGYQGRKASNQALGQTALEISKASQRQGNEQDQLTFQGAGLKENIISQRQAGATSDFVRKRDKEMKALAEAVTQRAFDLGMSAKELAFHNNSLVSDAGFQALARDYEKGRVDRRDLLKLMYSQQLEAQRDKLAAERMLSEIQGEMNYALRQGDIEAAKKRIKLALEKQKEAAKKAAKASSLGAIVSGVFTIGGGVMGAIYGGPAGAAGGASAGSSVGRAVWQIAS